jgi:hypothetical protein
LRGYYNGIITTFQVEDMSSILILRSMYSTREVGSMPAVRTKI